MTALCNRFVCFKCVVLGGLAAALLTPQLAAAEDAKKPPAGVVPWKKPDRKPVEKLTPAALDDRIRESHEGTKLSPAISDEQFLRRVSLDTVGSQPTPAETEAFLAADSATRRTAAVDRLLGDERFGRNWGAYLGDVIRYRTPQPELTFLNYGPLKGWLAEKLNAGATWDEITWYLVTAGGKVGENPAATFVGFHQASPTRLAGETSRVFLGQNLACAECHDHMFESYTQEQFHHLAAFFARVQAKLPHNDSNNIAVSAKTKGEHVMTGKTKKTMRPAVLEGEELAEGMSDDDRRRALAEWLAGEENEFYARAFVNRIWSRLMGRGFYEPVDHLSENVTPMLPAVLDALAEHFTASGYDIKGLFRLVLQTEAYRRGLPINEAMDDRPQVAASPQKLRGDEVFASLATAIELADVRPEKKAANGSFRFPPPPKSTRDLVDDAFGFDPSVDRATVPRTMPQAMWMMNQQQLQAEIDGSADSDTVLSRLLAAEQDDRRVVERLFARALARRPSDEEIKLTLAHVASINDRGEAFEDVLWSLLNSAEFVSRR